MSNKALIAIHATAKVSTLADIEASSRGSKITIGAGSNIDSFVKIKPCGGSGHVTIGEFCYINSGCVLYSGNGINIGNNVLIAANCSLAPVNHAYRDRDRLIRDQGFGLNRGGIIIEDDVWIGCNSVILDGAILRKGCVVAACSLIRGEFPAYSVCAGNPAVVKDFRK